MALPHSTPFGWVRRVWPAFHIRVLGIHPVPVVVDRFLVHKQNPICPSAIYAPGISANSPVVTLLLPWRCVAAFSLTARQGVRQTRRARDRETRPDPLERGYWVLFHHLCGHVREQSGAFVSGLLFGPGTQQGPRAPVVRRRPLLHAVDGLVRPQLVPQGTQNFPVVSGAPGRR